MPDDNNAKASDERRKFFGLLTAENVIQLVFYVAITASLWAKTSAGVDTNARDIQRQDLLRTALENKVDADAADARKRIEDVTGELRTATTINAQQQGEIGALQQSRDADRRILMDIASNVAVLLDRTDPRKTPASKP